MSVSGKTEFETHAYGVLTECRRYSGQVAIITGAAQGLGRVTAQRIAEEGGAVVIADLQADKANDTAATLFRETGRSFLAVSGDLSSRQDADRLVSETMGRFGRIDAFIACAAYQARLPFLEFTEEQMQTSVDTNIWALVRPLQSAIPVMMNQRYGRVVVVGGVASEFGAPWHSFLAGLGKGAAAGLMANLAAEFINLGITFNYVSAAGVETRNDGTSASSAGGCEATINVTAEQIERYLGEAGLSSRTSVLARELAHPTEVAAAIAFLGSREASFITGQTLRVAGGNTMLF